MGTYKTYKETKLMLEMMTSNSQSSCDDLMESFTPPLTWPAYEYLKPYHSIIYLRRRVSNTTSNKPFLNQDGRTF